MTANRRIIGRTMPSVELGFKDEWNDDASWGDIRLADRISRTSVFVLVHCICSHGLYSIPDLLRMYDFCCEVTITHRQTVEQDGTGWRKNCSYDVFASKLRAEADHRPHLRYGQFIYCRTAELIPDAVHKINASADCYQYITGTIYGSKNGRLLPCIFDKRRITHI